MGAWSPGLLDGDGAWDYVDDLRRLSPSPWDGWNPTGDLIGRYKLVPTDGGRYSFDPPLLPKSP